MKFNFEISDNFVALKDFEFYCKEAAEQTTKHSSKCIDGIEYVTNISWNEAMQYCNWKSTSEWVYNLPTEEQLEMLYRSDFQKYSNIQLYEWTSVDRYTNQR